MTGTPIPEHTLSVEQQIRAAAVQAAAAALGPYLAEHGSTFEYDALGMQTFADLLIPYIRDGTKTEIPDTGGGS